MSAIVCLLSDERATVGIYASAPVGLVRARACACASARSSAREYTNLYC